MQATIAVELEPFRVPNYVLRAAPPLKRGVRDENEQGPASYPLSDIDAETLGKMCDAFRDEVFRKAGKELPPGIREG